MRRLFPVIDHGCLAIGSLLITILAARDLSVSEFASFAALQLIVFLVVGAFRSGPGSWVVVAAPQASLDTLGAGLAFIGLVLGLAAGAVIAGVCLLTGLALQSAIWATIYLTGLLVVDALRFRCYRRQEVARASFLSFSAVSALGATFVLLRPSGAEDILAAAALSYGVIALAGCVAVVKLRLMLTGLGAVLHCGREMGKGTLAGYFGLSAFRLGAPFAMSVTGGALMLASFRGAQTLASVPLQVPESLRLPYLVQGARLYQGGADLPLSFVRAWPLMLCAVLGPSLILAMIVPDSLGEAVLGDTWGVASVALPLVIVGAFFNQLTVGIELIARLTGDVRHIARVRIWGGVLGLPVVALAARYGISAAMVAYAAICMGTWLWARVGTLRQAAARE